MPDLVGQDEVFPIGTDEGGLGLGHAVGDVVPAVGHPVGAFGIADEKARLDPSARSGITRSELKVEMLHPDHALGIRPRFIPRVSDLVGGTRDEEPAGLVGTVRPETQVDLVGMRSRIGLEVVEVGKEVRVGESAAAY